MRVPLAWLSQYVDLEGLEVEELADRLTLAGLEVEKVERLGPYQGLVVAKLVSVSPHPKADRLWVCQLEVGAGELIVVSGAPNLAAGTLVPLALPGARLPGGEVQRVTLRGVPSQGMILSLADLGLEAKSTGIWTLPPGPQPGQDLAPLIEGPDTVLVLKITPNRPDLLGIYGVAREVAALFHLHLEELPVGFSEAGTPAAELVEVELEDPEDCPRYLARLWAGVPQQPSPLWLMSRLLKAGMRPLTLPVDVTNYVMLELGQPLHAFDWQRLPGRRIGVRRARPGERLRTLDGLERELSPEVLLITVDDRPVAVAGVMGGEETEVREDTTHILLEAACFSPARIRRSSRSLGLRTEASLRFERGLSPELAELASRRASALLASLAPVEIAPGAVDAYPRPSPARRITLRKARVSQVLGLAVEEAEVTRDLAALGVELTDQGEAWLAQPPPWRGDLEREIDLIEEVARLYGYDRIPARPPALPLRAGEKDPREAFCDRVRQILASLGLSEIYSLGLVGGEEAEVPLRNPMATGQEGLRASLLGGLLAAVRQNLEAQNPGVAIFEVGRTFHLRAGEVVEEDRAGVALAGRPPVPLSGKQDYTPAHLKGLLEGLLSALRVEGVSLGEVDAPWLHPHRRAGIYLTPEAPQQPARKLVGWLGELSPELGEKLPGERRVLMWELSLTELLTAVRPASYRPLPRHPLARRDLSLLAPQELPEERLRELILAEPLVESCFLYDLYQGPGIPPGQRSLTYEVTFRHPERTLASEEVEEAVARILAQLEALGVRLRS
jgi:phenylalanyl-tRNA synthetase beta chain